MNNSIKSVGVLVGRKAKLWAEQRRGAPAVSTRKRSPPGQRAGGGLKKRDQNGQRMKRLCQNTNWPKANEPNGKMKMVKQT